MRPKKFNSAFTLIEVVVAVAIFGVISAIVFPALVEFLAIRDRVEAKHKNVVGLQKTFLFLSNDLRYAANRLSKNDFGELGKSTMILNKNDNILEFAVNFPDFNLSGESMPRRVKWRIADGVLQRIQYPVMDPDRDTREIAQSFLKDVESVEIEVMFIEDGRSNKADKWEQQTHLPDLIEITVELANDLSYQRVLSMQGGNNESALLASTQATINNQGQQGQGGGNQTQQGAGNNGNGSSTLAPGDNENEQ